jgi:type II secretory pathway pseudopilin PulG
MTMCPGPAGHMSERTMKRTRTIATAFTLLELIVVVVLLLLVAATVLPTVTDLIASSDNMQAYNILAGQITAARAEAIRNDQYYIVHVQPGNGRQMDDDGMYTDEYSYPDMRETTFSGIMAGRMQATHLAAKGSVSSNGLPRFADSLQRGNSWAPYLSEYDFYQASASDLAKISSIRFEDADGYDPKRIPGTVAFGELTAPQFVDDDGTFRNLDGDPDTTSNFLDFMTFSILFSPQGQLVPHLQPNFRYVKGWGDTDEMSGYADRNVRFTLEYGENRLFFSGNKRDYSSKDTNPPIWSHDLTGRAGSAGGDGNSAPKAEGEPGATGVTLFDYKKLKPLSGAERAEYLDRNGEFLPLNRFSGLVFKRR